jgi:phosphoribosylglycinamide formyltransferase-1
MKNIVVLVSGGGTNLQALIDAEKRGELGQGHISCVVSSSPKAYALERAAAAGIKTRVLPKKGVERDAYTEQMVAILQEEKADLVILAGFMVILGSALPKAFPNAVLNVHPALIPSFCGPGYYGLHVHEAVLQSGVKVTGATVHFVNEVCDGGPIILQGVVPIENGDTPEILQRRVMENVEWKLLPKAARLFCDGKISVTNGIAKVESE